MRRSEATEAEPLYRESAKWERHDCGHSPGYLCVFRDVLSWEPHQMSVLAKGFKVSLAHVASVEEGDNWMWRGTVYILLKRLFHHRMSFRVDPEALVGGMEEHVFNSVIIKLLLGFHRHQFLQLMEESRIPTIRRGRRQ